MTHVGEDVGDDCVTVTESVTTGEASLVPELVERIEVDEFTAPGVVKVAPPRPLYVLMIFISSSRQ